MYHDIFISYSSEDTSEAIALKALLQEGGLTCFLAPKDILAGEVFTHKIREALVSCKVVCVLATPGSMKSEWVVTEWGAAWALGKPLIPILLRCCHDDLPKRLQSLQCIDYHKSENLAQNIRELLSIWRSGIGVGAETETQVLQYGTPRFREIHQRYLHKPPSDLWLLSYTGETTDGMLLTFEELMLDIEVRLLVRDWRMEHFDEERFNASHPERPRDWAKSEAIRATATGQVLKPWAVQAGGKIRFEQRFYPHPPSAKVVLFLDDDEPFAGFFGFYRHDPEMELGHNSTYVDVGQPILQTEDPALLTYLRSDFEDRWKKALSFGEVSS